MQHEQTDGPRKAPALPFMQEVQTYLPYVSSTRFTYNFSVLSRREIHVICYGSSAPNCEVCPALVFVYCNAGKYNERWKTQIDFCPDLSDLTLTTPTY